MFVCMPELVNTWGSGQNKGREKTKASTSIVIVVNAVSFRRSICFATEGVCDIPLKSTTLHVHTFQLALTNDAAKKYGSAVRYTKRQP